MCGIAGIIGRLSERNRRAVRSMSSALAHRGPDGEGFFESTPDHRGNGVLFAHRRLSILDLSDSASQPMTDAGGRHTITYNGEIYNYVELRNRLRAEGQTCRSSGDTEVMLRLLSRGGAKSVGDLRGMFAFALWDDARAEVLIARDPMGIKPLYICRNPDASPEREWSVLFASEVRAILASGLLQTPRLNPTAVASFVWNGFVAGPDTIIDGIHSLPPGHAAVLDLDGNEKSRERFWHYPPANAPKDGDVASVRQALHESVEKHLASDVPLGIFLSGGIDSSAVANMAARASQSEVVTFTLAFEEQEYDEGPFAREIAKAIGTRHREVRFTEQDFLSSLDRALESIDQPTFDGLNSFYISQAVREDGIKVALVGSGGDELFGGYKSFRDLPRLQAIAQRLAWLPKEGRIAMARAIAHLADRSRDGVGTQVRWAKLPSMVAEADDLLQLYQLAYALFVPDFHRRLLNDVPDAARVASGLPSPLRRDLQDEIAGRSPLAALGILEQRLFLGERLLRDIDVASMGVSLETRLPLVDSVVTEAVTRLPDSVRYAPLGRKQLLRDVGLEGLSPALFERPKRGFQMPFDRWIRQRLGAEMDGVMRDPQVCKAAGLDAGTVDLLWSSYLKGSKGLYWSRVWAIYVLLRWCDRHAVSVQ
ncbi:MAG: asparagine synthase (glutamine-hydrolyzing) [Hyphomicrobium sp.]|nr:asparagine synthase (glutamine-hydrolyzing) [Hyphomicrobium sp.]